jgi:hypothetical protein
MTSGPQKIGGEYGEIRATINIDNLNDYLSKHTPSIKAPIDIKQFKVSKKTRVPKNITHSFLLKFGQVCIATFLS